VSYCRQLITFWFSVFLLIATDVSYAHGFTDEDWAMILLVYKNACIEMFPEKKSLYEQSFHELQTKEHRLASPIQNILEDEKQLDRVKKGVRGMLDNPRNKESLRKDLEKECKTLEHFPSTKQNPPSINIPRKPVSGPNKTPPKNPDWKPIEGDTLSLHPKSLPNNRLVRTPGTTRHVS
jgi:hypothetical protein